MASTVPESVRDRLGLAIAQRTYKAHRTLLDSLRWFEIAELENYGDNYENRSNRLY